jgi:hypothetical protein
MLLSEKNDKERPNSLQNSKIFNKLQAPETGQELGNAYDEVQ